MFRFENLEIWNFAIGFAKSIYGVTEKFPQIEQFTLGDQLRRASVSVSANIAEGSGSSTNKDFQNFLSIAAKSLFEVVSLLKIAEQNGYMSESEYNDTYQTAENLAKKIYAFRNAISN
ncbi:MAG: four helix bundle protein [Candidatus Sungbacteria bacterium]|uniref:Four helix bundle protein n=1 Tax=Candidatus Sungiibacteriota bacterium TaxID=2750080 RepID=A0A9D6LTV0_9BACT|nr:four helix bundle protein [Candidatus Sungbacteria bacterium]